ncbi:MAG: TrkH family potassium uptake protein [Burkholderiales bacterium]|nr:TrkH family potassium uptake protein [Burkholderiales bacterium]
MAVPASIASLIYAVRIPVVLKYLGELALVLAALALMPAVAGLYYREFAIAASYLAVAVALAAFGWPCARLSEPARIQVNEALVVTAAAYLLGSLAMCVPMIAAGIRVEQALFEAVSGITTTGLSTIANVEALPRTLLFGRAWLQWFGGLGIVVLSIALLLGNDVAARQLVDPAEPGEQLATTTRAFARRIAVVYIALTLLAIAGLAALGLTASGAVNYALAAISTGGFAPQNASVAAVGSGAARAAIVAIGLLGAISLPLYFALARGDWRRFAFDAETRALGVVLIAGFAALAFIAFARDAHGAAADLPGLALLTVSAQTTTGFAPFPIVTLDAASKLVLLVAMSVGGAVGSTAGGIKLLRAILVFRLLQLLLRRLSMPSRAVAELRVGGRKVEPDEALRALLFVLLFLVAALASWMPFLAAGYSPMDSLFEVVSALGTVGLSTGISSSELAPGLKAVLAADMLFGRVELVAMLILFYPPTWFARRSSES